MDWQQALRARLLAEPTITALVGQRVYWLTRPQGSALPAIVLRTIREEREQHMGGFQGFQSARVQIDAWSAEKHGSRHGYDIVTDLGREVIEALVPREIVEEIRFDRATVDGVRDLDERTETGMLYRKSIDLIIHHSPA